MCLWLGQLPGAALMRVGSPEGCSWEWDRRTGASLVTELWRASGCPSEQGLRVGHPGCPAQRWRCYERSLSVSLPTSGERKFFQILCDLNVVVLLKQKGKTTPV